MNICSEFTPTFEPVSCDTNWKPKPTKLYYTKGSLTGFYDIEDAKVDAIKENLFGGRQYEPIRNSELSNTFQPIL